MSREPISTSAKALRRLAVSKQHLSGRLPAKATSESIESAVRDLAYVQWDPVPAIAASHMISLWFRVGKFSTTDLEKLLWDEKVLFQHWTPIASIVLMEDYPIYLSLMKRYPESLSSSWGGNRARARKFLAKHLALRRRVLGELKGGPLSLSEFKAYRRAGRSPDGWTSGSDVSTMLFHLLMSGETMVVGHRGNQNVWGLAEEFLPRWVDKRVMTEEDAERAAAERAVRALGTASQREIHYYFVRGRYQNLSKALNRLERESVIQRVRVSELGTRDERFIHRDDIGRLESIESDEWEPRTSLIAPFDNLICGRARTNMLFGFDYIHEQFLPKEKRKFGTFVLPILRGDSLVGRADLRMDRERGKLMVNSLHAQPGAPRDRRAGSDIGEALAQLAEFAGAEEVEYSPHVPAAWRSSLR